MLLIRIGLFLIICLEIESWVLIIDLNSIDKLFCHGFESWALIMNLNFVDKIVLLWI